MIQLPAPDTHHTHQRHLDLLPRRRHARQHPGHGRRVREAELHLIDDAIRADGAREQLHRRVRRVAGDEVVAVEFEQVVASDPARHRRHVVHVRLRRHGRECFLGVLFAEFESSVSVPDRFEVACGRVRERVHVESASDGIEGPGPGQPGCRFGEGVVEIVFGEAWGGGGVVVDVAGVQLGWGLQGGGVQLGLGWSAGEVDLEGQGWREGGYGGGFGKRWRVVGY